MSGEVLCQLCGQPMPKGEEMFNYHGYSGPCPKPTSPESTIEVVPTSAGYRPPCTCRNFQGDHEEDCYWGATSPEPSYPSDLSGLFQENADLRRQLQEAKFQAAEQCRQFSQWQNAIRQELADARERVSQLEEALRNNANALTNCAMILDVVKPEWGDSWSDWDQSVRESITTALMEAEKWKP